MGNRTINLHINKIVLEGTGPLNRGQFSLALEKELQRLISSQGLHGSYKQSSEVARITTKAIVLPRVIREKPLGQKVANSIYHGIK